MVWGSIKYSPALFGWNRKGWKKSPGTENIRCHPFFLLNFWVLSFHAFLHKTTKETFGEWERDSEAKKFFLCKFKENWLLKRLEGNLREGTETNDHLKITKINFWSHKNFILISYQSHRRIFLLATTGLHFEGWQSSLQ